MGLAGGLDTDAMEREMPPGRARPRTSWIYSRTAIAVLTGVLAAGAAAIEAWTPGHHGLPEFGSLLMRNVLIAGAAIYLTKWLEERAAQHQLEKAARAYLIDLRLGLLRVWVTPDLW